ncbi:MAG: porin [Hyphomicrobiales bacterium]|nr:porin [Hyphomicrobiales bacterium]
MTGAKSLFLGSAAILATVATAQAADLPTRKAAPVQYVKICDAYGAGFFYIPGTDTCLRVGGLVLAAWGVQNTPFRVQPAGVTSVAAVNNGLGGSIPFTGVALGGANYGAYVPGANRDAVSSLALGRLELDARTQSPWGTVRAFMRVDSYFGAGISASTGAIPASILGIPAYTATIGNANGRETTTLNKAFIQFAGITMGRIQSMFDFYADAVGYTGLRGSNQTVNAIAYTLTMGGGFSATLSVEDAISHRQQAPVNTVLISNAFINAGGPVPSTAILNGTRIPDVVANLRLDQPWGSAQISGAVHQVSTGLYTTGGAAPGGVAPAFTFAAGPAPFSGLGNFANSSSLGFAAQGGVMFKLDMLAPGDVLWLQATYAKGAIGYLTGSNFAYVAGVDTSNGYAIGLARVGTGAGYNGLADVDCVWTMAGTCDKSTGYAVTGALRHYWTPTISSTLTGSYYRVTYSQNALNPAPLAAMINQNTGAGALGVPFISGMTNFTETRLTTGLEWNPIRGFGIGAEVAWQHGITSRPVGLASDVVLRSLGMPAWKSTADLIQGQVRMYRAF